MPAFSSPPPISFICCSDSSAPPCTARNAAYASRFCFPLSFRFLSTYQVSESIPNMITLSSYVSSFTTLSLLLGMAFEIPVIAYLLGRLHLIHAGMLKRFRKHALVGILIVAAIITPTSDTFTLLLVSLPLYLLYELSIRVVKSNP